MEQPPDDSRPPAQPVIDPVVGALAERLAVRFSDVRVALAAVTHKSYVNEHRGEGLQDNERLEFLGDAVIDLAVSHRLMERFPEAREGDLSKIRAALVDEAALAGIARDLDLGGLLRLGRGEELTGGRQKSSLLADAMEAVIAALYLEGGLAPVLALVDRFLGAAFDRAAAGTLDRDFKTQFQELAQSRLRASPRYRVVAEHGPDHSKVFDVELELRGEVVGRGAGRSKKDAEQAAAKTALEAMQARVAAEAPREGTPPAVATEGASAPSVEPPASAAGVSPSADEQGEGWREGLLERSAPSVPSGFADAISQSVEEAAAVAPEPAPERAASAPPEAKPQRKPARKRAAPAKSASTRRRPAAAAVRARGSARKTARAAPRGARKPAKK